MRNALTPMGCESYASVRTANLLVARLDVRSSMCCCSVLARSMLLILVSICMGGTVVIENPGSSLIWMHDRFQWLVDILEAQGIKAPRLSIGSVVLALAVFCAQMFKQSFWMRHFAAATPKRTCLWSTGSAIGALGLYATMKKGDFKPTAKTTVHYVNGHGEVAYKASAALKKTQLLICKEC